MKKLIAFVVLALFAYFPVTQAHTASGRVTMTVDLSGHGSKDIAQVWIPYPVSDTHQTITNIKIDGTMSSSGIYTEKKFSVPMLHARWDKGVKNRVLTFSFDVTRQEVIRKNFPDKEAQWDPADYAPYLSQTRLGPIDGEIKKLADSITAGKKSVLGKAKAIYDWTCENTYRNPDTRGCGVGDVYRLLKDPGGKCADISSIYVALARAAGVPAREILGIRQGKKPVQDISKWQHCWAEFYLPGYGWVPVDPADVRKMMLKENLTLADEKTTAWRHSFWGGIDAYRIKLGQGRDLVLNPPHSGAPVNYLMYPFAQIGAKTPDWLDPEKFTYKILYQRL
jgi:transglutaminase-like putative cysteine protease